MFPTALLLTSAHNTNSMTIIDMVDLLKQSKDDSLGNSRFK